MARDAAARGVTSAGSARPHRAAHAPLHSSASPDEPRDIGQRLTKVLGKIGRADDWVITPSVPPRIHAALQTPGGLRRMRKQGERGGAELRWALSCIIRIILYYVLYYIMY